jgi:hypothetical protein
MAEALDTRELAAALDESDDNGDGDSAKLTINDLPKELLASVFIAVDASQN